MPPYGLASDVRELARHVLVAEFSDAEILKEQLSAQARIWTVTQKTDWDSGDFQFEDVKKMEIKLAALYVLEHYHIPPAMLETMKSWRFEINDGLKAIVESSTDPLLDVDVIVVASDYESYPLNQENDTPGSIYRSTDSII